MKRPQSRTPKGPARTAVDPADILERLARLRIQTWSYTFEPGVRHIGPMAQEFAEVFGLGGDARRIRLNDAIGIAFAAIRGLHAMLEENEARLTALRAELEALRGGVPRPGPGNMGGAGRRGGKKRAPGAPPT